MPEVLNGTDQGLRPKYSESLHYLHISSLSQIMSSSGGISTLGPITFGFTDLREHTAGWGVGVGSYP